MKDLKYTTSFSSTIKALVSEEKDKYLALASMVDIGDLIPDVDTEANVDLLPVAFNAFVANRVNKNGDVIDTETAIAIRENFINKPINIEHNREKVIGTILTTGFSEFGTDKPLTEEQVKEMTGPFNVTLGGVIWKTVNDKIANFIEESSDPTSEKYLAVSASWELGFSDFNIVLLKNDEKNIEGGEIIAEEEQVEALQKYLRAFGGTELVDEETKAYRQVVGKVVPLGIGLTETPAADVKGISTKSTKTKEKLVKEEGEANNISPNRDSKKVISRRNTMKIKSIEDITDESLKEVSASAVSDFIESELKQASEKYAEEKVALETKIEEAGAAHETLTKDHEELMKKSSELEAQLDELVKANQEREAQEKFNQRMASLDEKYELTDEDRQVLAADIKELNDEDFEAYASKLSILLKDKDKELLAKKQEEQKQEEVTEEVKASEEKTEETSVEAVVEKAKADEEVEIPNSTIAEEETLVSRYQKAFDIDQFEIN